MQKKTLMTSGGEEEGEWKCGVRMPLMTVYQPTAAIAPLAASWKKEMSKAPRRKGKQHKKWRATMAGFLE